jgi:hypothetical protein
LGADAAVEGLVPDVPAPPGVVLPLGDVLPVPDEPLMPDGLVLDVPPVPDVPPVGLVPDWSRGLHPAATQAMVNVAIETSAVIRMKDSQVRTRSSDAAHSVPRVRFRHTLLRSRADAARLWP